MAKGKRSKIKQKHKREFNQRIAPAVAARVAELNEKLMTAVGGPIKERDVTMTDSSAPAVLSPPVGSEPVPLQTATLGTGGNKKLKSAAKKIMKTVSSTSQKKKQKIKIRVTSGKYEVKQ
eukprot:TRINITY_DN766_c0_g1_i1.p1 TRINITY_DN766_c0_g1~~TRINITY_DN766_c0_g1_i1.p1  ORF type:complete len:120 (+),score=30.77 TRINITY_DN766_c0_g1_i1:49-408(+)